MVNSNVKCHILGGAGFIGLTLAKKLQESGRRVVVVGRGAQPKNLPIGVTYLQVNLADTSSIRGLFSGVSEVIDLTYSSIPKAEFTCPLTEIISNLPITVAILEELSRSQVDRFIYVSSGGTVYGEALSLPINEVHLTQPISPYGVCKLASERYAEIFRICKDVPVIIARPSNAYGEYQSGNIGQGFIATAIWRCLHQKPITIFGEQGTIRDYIHVEDIAAAIVALFDKGLIGETYNIGTGFGVNNREIINLVTSQVIESGFNMPPVIVQPARSFDVAANILDIAKINLVTGWKPRIALPHGIARSWKHMLNQHMC